MPRTKTKSSATSSSGSARIDIDIQRLRDAVTRLADELTQAERSADTYAQQQLSAIVVHSAQARAVELRARLREANEALFLAESGADGAPVGAASVVDGVVDQGHEQAQAHAHEQAQARAHEQAQAQAREQAQAEPQADSSVAGQRAAAARDALARARGMVQQAEDERARLSAQKEDAERRRPLVVQRIEQLREHAADLAEQAAHAERDAVLMTRARLPEPIVKAQQARAQDARTHVADAAAALAEAEHELARLDEAERAVMPDLAEVARDAARMAEITADYERRMASLMATRAEKVAAARRACAAYVLALGDIGVYNWHAGLLATHKGIPPTLQTYRGLVGPAPGALVEAIDYNETVLAPAYWPALTLLPELPRELAGDVQSWAQGEGQT